MVAKRASSQTPLRDWYILSLVELGWVSFASKVSVPNTLWTLWNFTRIMNMIQRTSPSWSKWNSLYLEKSHTVRWNLMVFLAGVSRLFLQFWWNYPKNCGITWVIRFAENRPVLCKTDPKSWHKYCKTYTIIWISRWAQAADRAEAWSTKLRPVDRF